MEFFFLGLLVLAFPVIAIVALVKTVNINERLRAIEARFAALEARVAGSAAPAPNAPPRPEPVVASPEPAPSAPPAPPPPPPPPPSPPPPVEAVAAAPAPSAEQPAPEHVASFEEQFGTRWTVWIGGVALALGGIFLVKYSIEAGLIGPGL